MTSLTNLCFASADFDRQALKRTDSTWIDQRLKDDSSVYLVYWQNSFLTNQTENSYSLNFLDKSSAEQYNQGELSWCYMGDLTNTASDDADKNSVFAAAITHPTVIAENAHWSTLRQIGLLMNAEVASLLAYSQGLLNWHQQNNYCALCASEMTSTQAGNGLICSVDECSKEIFPRTDPAVIVLIHNQDACLLGRNASWPEGMYSCLAGFVETGEDLDAAVRREVYEESGLMLDNISYRGSQPWPFPQSIMLGFQAQSLSRELTFHDGEIEEAIWFTREQLIEAVETQQLRLSSSLSISYHLIEDWFNQESDVSLSDTLANIKFS